MQAAVRVPVTPSSGAPKTPRGRRCLVFQAQAQAPEKGTTVEVGLGLCPAASDSRGGSVLPAPAPAPRPLPQQTRRASTEPAQRALTQCCFALGPVALAQVVYFLGVQGKQLPPRQAGPSACPPFRACQLLRQAPPPSGYPEVQV